MSTLKWLGIEVVEVSWTEKLVSACGAMGAIFLVIWLTRHWLPVDEACCVIASMGASAVLLFAVPHGQLSQPWPVLGGHAISAFIGVACATFIEVNAVSAAVAVGASVGLMYHFKCIHPPGGATAFTAVMGGPAVLELGFGYVVIPVLVNSVMMLAFAFVINLPFSWRRYPASLNRPLEGRSKGEVGNGIESPHLHEDVLAAMRSLDSFVDINEEDLVHLAKQIVYRTRTASKLK